MINVNPPKIYAILNFESCGDPYLQLKKLLDNPFPWIQIRAKKLSKAELTKFIREAMQIRDDLPPPHAKLIVNDHVDVAVEVGADGVHLGQQDAETVNLAQLRELLGAESIIGLSTHTPIQAIEADKLPLSYIALGPIFSSSTKSGHAEIVGLEKLKQISAQVSRPIVAIGGINEENIASVYAAGARSAALISALE